MSEPVLRKSQSNIETIDGAFLNYVENLNIFCNTINGWDKVPVIWSSAERAFQIKNNREIRDKNGALIPPIISLERVSTQKETSNKGSFYTSVSPTYDRFFVAKDLNQLKTSNFANVDSIKSSNQINFATSKRNKKKVYKYYSAPIPVYITVTYKINILTNYQSQMNEIMQPFMSRTGQNYFLITNDVHRYECFMDENFEQESITNLGEEERKYKSSITVKVLGYLTGQGDNQESSSYDTIENAVEIKLNRENVIIVSEESSGGDKGQQSMPGIITKGVTSVALKKSYLIGNAVDSVYTIYHYLNTRDIYVAVRENFDDYSLVEVAIDCQDLNHIHIHMGDVIDTNSYSVVILG